MFSFSRTKLLRSCLLIYIVLKLYWIVEGLHQHRWSKAFTCFSYSLRWWKGARAVACDSAYRQVAVIIKEVSTRWVFIIHFSFWWSWGSCKLFIECRISIFKVAKLFAYSKPCQAFTWEIEVIGTTHLEHLWRKHQSIILGSKQW